MTMQAAHIPITVPSDTPMTALVQAMTGIGLRVARGAAGATLQFERAPTVSCEHPGCSKRALITDGVVGLCGEHWMELTAEDKAP